MYNRTWILIQTIIKNILRQLGKSEQWIVNDIKELLIIFKVWYNID